MNNQYFRNLMIRIIDKYHFYVKKQLDIFTEKQRNFQRLLELKRDNWYLTKSEMHQIFKMETYKIKINTLKTISEITNNPIILDLQYISLINILYKLLLEKYKKSENSFNNFFNKIYYNRIKTFQEKQHKLITKKTVKLSKIDNDKLNKLITTIENLKYTTENCKNERLELISKIKCLGKNKFDIRTYVNYLPDHVYNSLQLIYTNII